MTYMTGTVIILADIFMMGALTMCDAQDIWGETP